MVTESDVVNLLRSPEWFTSGVDKKNLTRHLRVVAKNDDQVLASRAIYLASQFNTKACIEIVKEAAASHIVNLQIAAASVASDLPRQDAIDVLSKLLDSKTSSIRKKALESAEKLMAPELLPNLTLISKKDTVFKLKRHAKNLVKQLTDLA